MLKNLLIAAVLLIAVLEVGCAKGGNGIIGGGIVVTISNGDIGVLYPTEALTFTATVTGTTNTAVTWSLSGTGCTGAGNPCGTINATTGAYVAPSAPPTPPDVTIIATSAANSEATGQDPITIQLVTVVVTPSASSSSPVNVGESLKQQFTAVTVPDQAPQTFTWSVNCTGGSGCGSIAQDPNTSGLAVYTAPASTPAGVVVTATSAVTQTPPGSGTSAVTVVSSRLPSGTYAFQFSGYDNSNNPVAAAGSFTLANGTISAGIEDVLSATGPHQYPIASATFSPISSNNQLGTLTLGLGGGGPTNKYTAVVTASGTIRMIEDDSTGTGSGVMQISALTKFNKGAESFAFGFTGVNSTGNRVGYVGLLPMNGAGLITGGLLDANDNGSMTTVCATPPCTIASTSSYAAQNANLPTWWSMQLITGATTRNFDFFISSGTTQNKTGPGSLTLYAISTDPVDSTHPALSGSMVYQVPMASGYNNAAFDGTSISALTGTNANVSLTVGTTDGTSGGTGGTGNFAGAFDWNNNGAVISVKPTATSPTIQFSYTYVATSSNLGRYTFQMLGNPLPTPALPPIPFILYASGANRGFLLDQSSTAVITGTMNPQPSLKDFAYTPTELPGPYAAATISNSDPSIAPVTQNLLLTSTGNATFNVDGTQNPNSQALTGTYTLVGEGVAPGTGTILLTNPPAPAAATNVIYAIDANLVAGTTNDVVTDFMMMGACIPVSPASTCTAAPSALVFAQQ
jgi:hypothetical protein